MKNIMLDLETLSTRPDAMIVSIGAVWFDKADIIDEFYEVLPLSQQEGRHIDSGAVEWWMNQSAEARKVFAQQSKIELGHALAHFNDFCLKGSDINKVVMWGNGSDFDNVLLRNLYNWWKKNNGNNFFEITPPWRYYNSRCFRTLKNLNPALAAEIFQSVPKQVEHNALDDAGWQARVAQKLLPDGYWS